MAAWSQPRAYLCMFPQLILHAAELIIFIFSVYLRPEAPDGSVYCTVETQLDKRAANVNGRKNSETGNRIRGGGVLKGSLHEVLLGAS